MSWSAYDPGKPAVDTCRFALDADVAFALLAYGDVLTLWCGEARVGVCVLFPSVGRAYGVLRWSSACVQVATRTNTRIGLLVVTDSHAQKLLLGELPTCQEVGDAFDVCPSFFNPRRWAFHPLDLHGLSARRTMVQLVSTTVNQTLWIGYKGMAIGFLELDGGGHISASYRSGIYPLHTIAAQQLVGWVVLCDFALVGWILLNGTERSSFKLDPVAIQWNE